MKYVGTASTNCNGIFYLPTALLNISGGGTLGSGQVIVGSVDYTGGGGLTINYIHYTQPFEPIVQLVE